MPPTERGTRTRALIVAGASELFAERGFTVTSIGDVVERIGITKGAFYFHFDSKVQLAEEVVDEYRNLLQRLQVAAAATEAEPVRRVARMLLPLAISFQSNPIARASTRLLEQSNQLRLEPAMNVQIPWWLETMQAAAADGQLRRPNDLDALAWAFNAAVYGTISNSFAVSRWADLPLRMANLIRYFLLPTLTAEAAAMVAGQLADAVELEPAPSLVSAVPVGAVRSVPWNRTSDRVTVLRAPVERRDQR